MHAPKSNGSKTVVLPRTNDFGNGEGYLLSDEKSKEPVARSGIQQGCHMQ